MRRLPPTNVENNLANLCDIAEALVEDLLSSVDQPLKVAHDGDTRRDYLLCDYNRDSDSYRSPWSSKYDPALPDGNQPSQKLRQLEIQANEAFDIYRDLYFEGGVSSVYLWDLEGTGFAGVVLIKKTQDQSKQGQPMKGTWDAIHVVEVEEKKKPAHYKLTSTVMLSIETTTEQTGKVSLAGNLTRQVESDAAAANPQAHIANIGRLVEDMEIKLRTTLETIYFGKTKDIVNQLRSMMGSSLMKTQAMMTAGIVGSMKK